LIMSGIPKDMFMPLSMAVAFAMIVSFLASQTFVPILANWMMKNKHEQHEKKTENRALFEKFRMRYSYRMRKWSARSLPLFFAYLLLAGGVIFILIRSVGTDIMPVT